MTDKQRELLKKLQALAERGVGGEKEGAERKLKELIKKYGIEEDGLLEDKEEEFEFHFKGKWEKKLLRQLFYKMFGLEYANKTYGYRYGKGSKSIYGINCTRAEGLQLQVEFEFYKSLYYEELELFQDAFIQKHKIFDLKDKPDDKEYTIEEKQRIMRMCQMMEGMQNKSINPMIEMREEC
nr:MAG TPA: Protein of unknown function (DUF2786) [Caudoviricetes sp.]